jgi:hypothetical protein
VASLVAVTWVRSFGEQHSNDGGVVGTGGVKQRCYASVVFDVAIGAGIEQQSDDCRVFIQPSHGHFERRRSGRVASIDIGAGAEEGIDDIALMIGDRNHQWSASVPHSSARVDGLAPDIWFE